MKTMMSPLTSLEMFEEKKNNENITVFVFSANWCPDCMFIKPFMPKLIEKYQAYEFIYVDRDDYIELCQDLSVLGIPSFVAYKKGNECGRFVSKLRKTEAQIDEFLADLNQ